MSSFLHPADYTEVINDLRNLWIKLRTFGGRNLGPQGAGVLAINIVPFDHAIESLSIDGQYARRGLFVTARVIQNTSNVPSFDF